MYVDEYQKNIVIKKVGSKEELEMAFEIKLEVFNQEQKIPAEDEIDDSDKHANITFRSGIKT